MQVKGARAQEIVTVLMIWHAYCTIMGGGTHINIYSHTLPLFLLTMLV